MKEVILERVESKDDSKEFNRLISEFHYLKKPRKHGRQLKYFIKRKDILLGCIQFSDPVWTVYQKYKMYYNGQIVENSRFLLLKKVKNLGSRALKLFIDKIKNDWTSKTGINPKLLISYVDIERGFLGTVYKAANFNIAGKTCGKNLNRWGANRSTSVKLLFQYNL